jgi:hypothetical protein
LSCLANSSLDFPLITISSLSSEVLSSDCTSPPSVLRASHPLCYMSFLLLLLLLLIQFGFFLFFPWLRVSLSKGIC